MIHTLRRNTRDASSERCSRASAAIAAAASTFEAAVSPLRAAGWHVTVSGRTYCPACAPPNVTARALDEPQKAAPS